MKKIFFLVFLALFVVLAISLFLNYKKSEPETTVEEPSLVDSSQVDPDNFSSQYTAERLIRGIITDYDQKTNLLTIKQQGSRSDSVQIFQFQIKATQSVYCWPQYINNVDISEAYMPLEPGKIIFIKGEESVFLQDIVEKIKGKYAFLQTGTNEQLLKLAVLSCYD